MMGGFLTKVFVMILGYAYPAYECYKTVELNKPEIEKLLFWCQYWILVAVLAVFERVGDALISWMPLYGEFKLALFVYLWHPKTKGTAYIYKTFFRPYISKHEDKIDRTLLELRTRAADLAARYWHRALRNGRSWFLEILQYVLSQPSSPRVQPVQEPRHAQHTPTASSSSSPPDEAEQPLNSQKLKSEKNENNSPTSPPSSASGQSHHHHHHHHHHHSPRSATTHHPHNEFLIQEEKP